MMSLAGTIRYLQGERPGMRAGAVPPADVQTLVQILEPQTLWAPTIAIQTSVQLSDVSFWQEDVDFAVMQAAGLAGAIIRAGQRNWEDSKFKINWQRAKAAGMPRGSYWFYDSRETPKRQAELWANLIGADDGELIHAADFEESYGGPYGKREHFREFLERFRALTGLPSDRIVIYTGYYWWIQRVGNDPFFARFRLWLAWYSRMQDVRIPPPWGQEDLILWQHTSSGDGKKYGVDSLEIDLNFYCCDRITYDRQFNLISSGDPMADYIYKITPTGTAGSKVRTEPDTGNTSNLVLPYGKYAYGNKRITIAEDKWEGAQQVNKAGDVWLEVVEVNGSTLPQPGYIAEIHLGQRYATITQIGTPPVEQPPEQPTLPDLPVQIVLGDDITYTRQTINITLKPK